MAKSLVEMAAELVQAQCTSTSLSADEMVQALQVAYKALHDLQAAEAAGSGGAAAMVGSPEKSIQKHKIVCLECGEEFKMLSAKHLSSHGLTGREYRKKWGLPLRQSLCAKELSDRRKKAGRDRGLPENLRKHIESKRGGAKTAKSGRATKAGRATKVAKVAKTAAAKTGAAKVSAKAPRKTVRTPRKPKAAATSGQE